MSAAEKIEKVENGHAQAVLDAVGGSALAALRSVVADAKLLCADCKGRTSISVMDSAGPEHRI